MDFWNFRGKQNSISDALQVKLPEHAVISITGAGGKTSLVFAWASELAAEGKRVAITTTTHMQSPESMRKEPTDLYAGIPVISVKNIGKRAGGNAGVLAAGCVADSQGVVTGSDDDTEYTEYIKEAYESIDRILLREGMVFAFSPDPSNPAKVTALPEEVLDHLRMAADVLLIEADGSRRMPLKWPKQREPAVPDFTDITVCVGGLSALNKNAEEAIYGSEEIPLPYLKKKTEQTGTASGRETSGQYGSSYDPVDERLMRAILSSADGGRKGIAGDFRVFLNQADDESLRASAERMQREFSVMGIQCAWGSLRGSAHDQIIAEALSEPCVHVEKATNKESGGKRIGATGKRIAIILEAAGNSTRFGSNKLMHIMEDGRPMISNILDAVSGLMSDNGDLCGSETDQDAEKILISPVLVTQYEDVASLAKESYRAYGPIGTELSGAVYSAEKTMAMHERDESLPPEEAAGGEASGRILIVINRHPELGISHSMQLGIEAAGGSDAYMFCVCDQPGLTADTLRRIIDAYLTENKKGTADIVSLAWQGRMCNPKIFSSKLREELMDLSGDTGGRQIIAAHSDKLVLLEAASQDEVEDIDYIG